MTSVLSITDLHVAVSDGKTPILKGVNLEIRSGEIHALMGPREASFRPCGIVRCRRPGVGVHRRR